jgi:hypothetical protein
VNLQSKIKELKLDTEVVNECLNLIKITEIKCSPYGYFGDRYRLAMSIVTNRRQSLIQQRQLEELVKQDYLSAMPLGSECKSPNECITEIKNKLGIRID